LLSPLADFDTLASKKTRKFYKAESEHCLREAPKTNKKNSKTG